MAVANAESKNTTLTAFFQLNREHQNDDTPTSPRHYLYHEIPLHFVKNSENEWVLLPIQ